jgi:hypothetical protein
MRKISMFLCVMMVLTLSLSSFAYASTFDSKIVNPKVDVQQLLEESNGVVSDVSFDKSKNEKSFKLTYSDGDVNFFKEKKFANGDIRYTINDESITNTIDVKGSTIYLDGEQVLFGDDTSRSDIGVMTVNTYSNSSTPHQSASSYTVSKGYSNKYVSLPEPLRNILKGAIITLIGYVAVYAGIAAFVFDSAYTMIKAANPDTTKLYYRQYCWEWSGNNSLTGVLFYKYKTNWYTNSARTNLAESKISYTMYTL